MAKTSTICIFRFLKVSLLDILHNPDKSQFYEARNSKNLLICKNSIQKDLFKNRYKLDAIYLVAVSFILFTDFDVAKSMITKAL